MSASDPELLQQYVAEKSEPAFRELIERRIGLVYSVALRNAGFDDTAAEEVSQQVFILLSQKARELIDHPSLTAWLFTATRQIAMRHHRSELRRRVHDQKAHEMSHALAPEGPAPDWTSLRPVIDQAIAELDETDQRAVLWRFFEKQGYAWIGSRLGVSEEAARKRVTRALDTLHGALSKRGVTSTAAAIGLALEGNAVTFAPSGLAARILGSVAATGAFLVPVGSTALMASRWGTHFTGYKLGFGLAGLVAVGALGFRALHPPNESTRPIGDSETGIVASNGPVDPVARLHAAVQARAQKSAADLDEARRRLREVLTSPARAGNYPPEPLLDALALFGEQMGEAVPILVDAIRVEDSETQMWALSGLQRVLRTGTGEDLDGSRSKAMSEIRPLLGSLLLDANRSDTIRLSAFGILCPSKPHRVGQPDSEVRYDPDSLAIVEKALHSTPKKTDSLRFTIVDLLALLGGMDPETEQVIRRMIPMLDAPVEEDRILAAYAIAKSSIEKPASVKTVLLATVKVPYHFSRSRAATGLGALGTNAVEAVPILLEYARTAPSPTSGERENVLTAACRIQPELRASYPEIDRLLKQGEQALLAMDGRPEVQSLRAGILQMAAEGDEQVKLSLRRGIGRGSNTEETRKQREMLLAALDRESQSGTDEEKALLQRVADLIRSTPVPTEHEASAEPKPLPMGNLTLSARVLLTDEPNAKEREIEAAVERFESEKIRSGVFPVVTKESAEALSKILDRIDPAFCKQWRQQVLKDYPWLDRIMRK